MGMTHPELDQRVLTAAVDAPTVEHDRAGLRPQRADDTPKQRGLARAIGSHQTDDLPSKHVQRHVANCHQTSKASGDTSNA